MEEEDQEKKNEVPQTIKTFFRKKTFTEHGPFIDESLNEHYKKRNEILKKEHELYFSSDIEKTLTNEEKQASQLFEDLKHKLITDRFNPSIHDYFEQFPNYISS